MTNPEKNETKLSVDLKSNIDYIQNKMGFPSDLVIREFKIGTGHSGAIICIDGLVNRELVNELILKSMLINLGESNKTIPAFGDELVTRFRAVFIPGILYNV
ncbi:spore germination protein [Paenibacillus sp. RC67]|uniref:spore germination protein n=1 Tax=Paenibacillus sp. RC67 TaxID=3039392 RepID=UPI0024ACDE06|nr:spore germination protein [Paenibacillus sp. RC67]